jgi:hypothetical protein
MQQCNQMGKVDETFPFFFGRPSLFRERRKKEEAVSFPHRRRSSVVGQGMPRQR